MATQIKLDDRKVAKACEKAIKAIRDERARREAENAKPRKFWQSPPYHEMEIAFYAGEQEEICESLLKMCEISARVGEDEISVSRSDFRAFESFLDT